MTKKISVTGFDAEEYAGFSIEEIPLSLIDEPYRYRSPRRIAQYLKMLKEGKEAPPIELIRVLDDDPPYDIFNGGHRYKAALLAGRTTILAVVVGQQDSRCFYFFPRPPRPEQRSTRAKHQPSLVSEVSEVSEKPSP
jgi:hypothetical protein